MYSSAREASGMVNTSGVKLFSTPLFSQEKRESDLTKNLSSMGKYDSQTNVQLAVTYTDTEGNPYNFLKYDIRLDYS